MNDTPTLLRLCFASWIMIPLVAGPVLAQRDDFNRAPINYETADVNDPVARLARELESGTTSLAYEQEQGYLKSVLEALEIPISSQTLVFSKTSMQRTRISPRTPRAVYFNDDVYVGYCQNGRVLELAATDPQQGAIFYTLDQATDRAPRFIRDRGQCLTCHASSRTQYVPGYLIRSVFTNASGLPEFGQGTFTTDHTSPFQDRWGGWYVTGTHGDMRHMGNAIFDKREDELNREPGANLTTLEGKVSTAPYLSEHSDIVALMVLEHQTQLHNAIAWANYETRRALHQSRTMNEILDRPSDFISESAERRMNSAATRVLEYLLMCDEAPLTARVSGTSRFARDFQAQGIRDREGRSLRDLDLNTRMFRYPCSYLIYSDAFAGLPDEIRVRILARLKAILSDDEGLENDARLTREDRGQLLAILNETLPEFAAVTPASGSAGAADTPAPQP